jgi:hypothetical protein
MATEAKIVISAEDRTRAALESAKTGLQGLHSTALSVTSSFAALGLTAATVNLARGVKGAIDEWDELGKSAQRAGFQSAQGMAEFQYAAKLAGVDASGFETAIGKLSSKMADAAGGGKEATAIFTSMGIKVKDASGGLRNTEAVVSDLARAFAGYKDGPAKTALAMELFGKSGRDLIPLLNGGAEGLSKLGSEFKALRGEVSAESTRAAEAFNDNLIKLQTASGKLAHELTAQLLPSLGSITERMVIAAQKGGMLRAAMAGLDAVGDELFGWTDKQDRKQLTVLEGDLRSLQDQAALIKIDLFGTKGDLAQQISEKLREVQAARDKFYRVTDGSAGGGRGFVNPSAVEPVKGDAPGSKTGGASAASEYDTLIKRVKERLALSREEIELGKVMVDQEKFYAKVLVDMGLAKKGLTDKQRAAVAVKLEELKASDLANARQRAEYEQAMTVAKERQRLVAEGYDQAKQLDEVNIALNRTGKQTLAQIEFETSLLSMNTREREIATAMRDLEEKGIKRGTPAWEAYAEAIAKATGKKADLTAQADRFTTMFQSVDTTAKQVFTNIFEGGAGTFKRLGQTLKASLLDVLYQMTVRKWVIQIAGSVTGAPASAIAQAIGTGGGSAGGLGGLGSLLGGGGSFGSGLSAGFGSLLGEGGLMGGLSAGTTAIGAGNILGGLGTLAGALGPIAIGIGLVASLLKGHGETRSGGQYNMGKFVTGPSGGEIGTAGQASKVTADSINATLKAIGSSSQLTNLFTGVESSEKGKGFAYAGGTLSTGGAFGQGWGDAFTSPAHMNRRGNMTPEQAMAAYTTELKQATLQALQVAADVPAVISSKLKGIDIDSMADAELDGLLTTINTTITGVTQLRQAVALLPFENLKNLSFDAAGGLIEMAGGIETLVSNLTTYYSNFYSKDEQRLQTARNIKAQLDAAGGTFSLDQILKGSRSQFREVTEAFANRTDEAGRKFYLAMLSVSSAFASITPEIEAATSTVAEAGSLYAETLRSQSDALETTIDRFDAFADSLKRFLHELDMGALAQLSPEERYLKASAEFNRISALPTTSEERLGGIEQAGREFLEASQAYNASNMAYFVDLAKVKGAVQASETASRATADVARLQLTVLQSQLSALNTIAANTSPAAQGQTTAGGAPTGTGGGGGAAWGGSPTTSAPGVILTSGGIPFDMVGYINSHLGDPGAIASTAKAYGISQAWIASAMGKNLGDVQAWFSTQGIQPFAKGGAFTNGVVTSPTLFPIGVMGESTPEAIMPLSRGPGGRLGVVSTGSSNVALEALVGSLIAEVGALRGELQSLKNIQISYAQRDLANGDALVASAARNSNADVLAAARAVPLRSVTA